MSKCILLVLLGLIGFGSKSQTKINEDLKKQLDSILVQDQIFREYIDNQTTDLRKLDISKIVGHPNDYSDNNIWLLITKTDSINLLKVEKIVQKYGYPGESLVGERDRHTLIS
jgi:hypothetical protein